MKHKTKFKNHTLPEFTHKQIDAVVKDYLKNGGKIKKLKNTRMSDLNTASDWREVDSFLQS